MCIIYKDVSPLHPRAIVLQGVFTEIGLLLYAMGRSLETDWLLFNIPSMMVARLPRARCKSIAVYKSDSHRSAIFLYTVVRRVMSSFYVRPHRRILLSIKEGVKRNNNIYNLIERLLAAFNIIYRDEHLSKRIISIGAISTKKKKLRELKSSLFLGHTVELLLNVIL